MTTGRIIATNLLAGGFEWESDELTIRDFRKLKGEDCAAALARRIDEALRAEWPEGCQEIIFSVRVPDCEFHEGASIVGFSGPIEENTIVRLKSSAIRIMGEYPAPGWYLFRAEPIIEGDLQGARTALVAYETEQERAARLAQEDGNGQD